MTIKEIAARAGLSHQAIYKRLKARGVKLEMLKVKQTGELTPEGAALLLELFPAKDDAKKAAPAPPPKGEEIAPPAATAEAEELRNQVEKLQTEVEKLNNQVEKLRNQVATMEEKEKALTEERDFLRLSLERSQQLQAITAAKIPNPPPAITEGGDQRRGIRAWWNRITSK